MYWDEGRKFMKATAIRSPAPNGTPTFWSDAVPSGSAAPSTIPDEGQNPSRSAYSVFRAIRMFLSGLVDSSAYQEISAAQEICVIFTSNGPLVYRPGMNDDVQNKPARSSKN
jgi:hypothetical protein